MRPRSTSASTCVARERHCSASALGLVRPRHRGPQLDLGPVGLPVCRSELALGLLHPVQHPAQLALELLDASGRDLQLDLRLVRAHDRGPELRLELFDARLQPLALPPLVLELAGQRRAGLQRGIPLGDCIGQRALGRDPRLLARAQLGARVIRALLALQRGQLVTRLLDLALELGSGAARRVALGRRGGPDRVGVGPRLVEIGARGFGVGPRSLDLGPRGVRVGPGALDLRPGGLGIVAESLTHQLERALELLRPPPLAGQRAVELGGLLGQLRLGVTALAVFTRSLKRTLELRHAPLRRLEVRGQLLVRVQRRVAFGHGGGALGSGLGEGRLLLGGGGRRRGGRRGRCRAAAGVREEPPLGEQLGLNALGVEPAPPLDAKQPRGLATRDVRLGGRRGHTAHERRHALAVAYREPEHDERVTSLERPNHVLELQGLLDALFALLGARAVDGLGRREARPRCGRAGAPPRSPGRS